MNSAKMRIATHKTITGGSIPARQFPAFIYFGFPIALVC